MAQGVAADAAPGPRGGPIPRAALDECTARGFAAVPGLGLDAGALERAMAAIGPLTFTPGESPHPEHPHTFVVTNRGRTGVPRSVFHSDTSYVPRPPSYTALAAVEVPDSGGETVFVDQFEALASAPASLRAALAGVELLHVASRVADPGTAGQGAWHPVLRLHPVTGRVALYVSARERLVGARRDGAALGDDEAAELIDAAHEQAATGRAGGAPRVAARGPPADRQPLDAARGRSLEGRRHAHAAPGHGRGRGAAEGDPMKRGAALRAFYARLACANGGLADPDPCLLDAFASVRRERFLPRDPGRCSRGPATSRRRGITRRCCTRTCSWRSTRRAG